MGFQLGHRGWVVKGRGGGAVSSSSPSLEKRTTTRAKSEPPASSSPSSSSSPPSSSPRFSLFSRRSSSQRPASSSPKHRSDSNSKKKTDPEGKAPASPLSEIAVPVDSSSDDKNPARSSKGPYDVVLVRKALTMSARVGSKRRSKSKDIPIHQLPVVMTDKELNPYYFGSSSASADVLDLSSTTEEEGYETPVKAFSDDEEQDDEHVARMADRAQRGGRDASVRYALAAGAGPPPASDATKRISRTRSKSPLKMMVTAPAKAGGAAAATSTMTTRSTPPSRSPQAAATTATASAPDRSTTKLPFDQPERFMDLSHAVRRMLVAAGGCGGGGNDDEDAGIPDAKTPAAKGLSDSASAVGGGGAAYPFPGFLPSNLLADATLCGHGITYYPQNPVPAASAAPPPEAGMFAMSVCQPQIWPGAAVPPVAVSPPHSPSSASVPHQARPQAAQAGCHPALMASGMWPSPYTWNCAGGLVTAATSPDHRDRHCMTGMLSVDEMEADSLVDMEDREQRAASSRKGVLATARDAAAVRAMSEEYDAVQDPEEELAVVSRSASPSPLASGRVSAEDDVEVRERSSTPRPNQAPKEDKDHPDDELVSKPLQQLKHKPSSSTVVPTSPGGGRGVVRFDDKAKQVHYLQDEEDATETDTYDASLLEEAPTEPSEEEDEEEDDDIYDDEDYEGSMDSAEYIEFLRHHKERRFGDCADAAEQSGCSEHYAEYQKHRRKRRRERGGKDGGGGCHDESFSLSRELADLFSDCTYLFRFFNDQYLGIGRRSGASNSAAQSAASEEDAAGDKRRSSRRRRSQRSKKEGDVVA